MATPISVRPRRSINGRAAESRPRATARTTSVCAVECRSVCERVAREKSLKRRRSTTVRPTRLDARRRRVDAVDERDEIGIDLLRDSAPGRALAARRSSGDGGAAAPAGHPRCSQARADDAPHARPSNAANTGSSTRASSPTVVIPRSRSFAAVTWPTPQTRSTGSGWRKSNSPSGGTTSSPSGFAPALATFARNFVRAMPTLTGNPTSFANGAPKPHRDLDRRAGNQFHAANVEERLVDRQPLDQRRRVVEDGIQSLARLGVGRHSGRDDDRRRAEPVRLTAAHRRPNTVRLRLIARREHHPATDNHRPPA